MREQHFIRNTCKKCLTLYYPSYPRRFTSVFCCRECMQKYKVGKNHHSYILRVGRKCLRCSNVFSVRATSRKKYCTPYASQCSNIILDVPKSRVVKKTIYTDDISTILFILPMEAQQVIHDAGLGEFYFDTNFTQYKRNKETLNVLFDLQEVKDWIGEKYPSNLESRNILYSNILAEYQSLDHKVWGL